MMMNEIQCPVCGRFYNEEEALCPFCRFPNISLTNDSAEESGKLRQLIEEYKNKHRAEEIPEDSKEENQAEKLFREGLAFYKNDYIPFILL